MTENPKETMMSNERQTWVVTEWDTIDGGILGAMIICPFCDGEGCHVPQGCDGTGLMHRPYRLPNGALIDLHRDGEVLIQTEPSDDTTEENCDVQKMPEAAIERLTHQRDDWRRWCRQADVLLQHLIEAVNRSADDSIEVIEVVNGETAVAHYGPDSDYAVALRSLGERI